MEAAEVIEVRQKRVRNDVQLWRFDLNTGPPSA
jgi:hypothetical protein